MPGPIVTELGNDNSDDYHAKTHDDRAYQQHGFTTDSVDNQLCVESASSLGKLERLHEASGGFKNVPWRGLC